MQTEKSKEKATKAQTKGQTKAQRGKAPLVVLSKSLVNVKNNPYYDHVGMTHFDYILGIMEIVFEKKIRGEEEEWRRKPGYKNANEDVKRAVDDQSYKLAKKLVRKLGKKAYESKRNPDTRWMNLFGSESRDILQKIFQISKLNKKTLMAEVTREIDELTNGTILGFFECDLAPDFLESNEMPESKEETPISKSKSEEAELFVLGVKNRVSNAVDQDYKLLERLCSAIGECLDKLPPCVQKVCKKRTKPTKRITPTMCS